MLATDNRLPGEILRLVYGYTLAYPRHCREYVARAEKWVGKCKIVLEHTHRNTYTIGGHITPSLHQRRLFFELRKCKRCGHPMSIAWIRERPMGNFMAAKITMSSRRPCIGACGDCIYECFYSKAHRAARDGRIEVLDSNGIGGAAEAGRTKAVD